MPNKSKVEKHLENARNEKKARLSLEEAQNDQMYEETELEMLRNEAQMMRMELEEANRTLHRMRIQEEKQKAKAKEDYNKIKHLRRANKRLKQEKMALQSRVWNLEKSRAAWKMRKRTTKRERRLARRRKTVLNAEQAIKFTTAFHVTGNKYKRMKAFMRLNKVDFFPIRREQEALIQRIVSKDDWSYVKKTDKHGVLYRKNIREEIGTRLKRLTECGQLLLDAHLKVYLCFVGDTGADLTKVSLFILDVDKANDPLNLSLVGLYQGNDTAENLRLFFNEIFSQLDELDNASFVVKLDEQEVDISTELVDTGDMPWIVNQYGCERVYNTKKPCVFCYAPKNDLIGNQYPPRTLKSMEIDFLRQENGQKFPPAVHIPLENVVPSSLHLFLGIVPNIYKKLMEVAEEINPSIPDQIDAILSRYRIDKRAWFQVFTGNHIRKLLATKEILMEILELFPKNHAKFAQVSRLIETLLVLGDIQECTRSRFLSEEDLAILEEKIQEYEEILLSSENPRITPKSHWLIRHVVPFARKHRFWALASEQSIESLHAIINEDRRRFSAIKEEAELLWQIAKEQTLRNFFFDTNKL